MKSHLFVFLLVALACPRLRAQDSATNDYPSDRTPTMGWSSWNTFALNINENVIKNQASEMVKKGLYKVGYKYINIDDGFWNGRGEDGRLILNTSLFPSGMQALTKYIHQRGLKAGIYSDAGDNTCGSGNTQAYGLGVGLYGHEDEDCDLYFKDWDFDFIKVDYCGGMHLGLNDSVQYTRISQAIQRCAQEMEKPIVFNICRWAYPGTWVDGICDSWRTTGDIYCAWESVKGIIRENLYIQAYTSRGHYNDMDMLEIGRTLTHDEEVTHMAYWCIASSPLLIGCDLASVPAKSLRLLKNTDLIAMNQDTLGLGAPLVDLEGDVYTVAKDVEQLHGPKRAVVMMNLGDEEATATLRLSAIDMEGTATLHDCLTGTDETIEESKTVTIPAHGSAAYYVTGTRTERTRYQAEEAWMPLYQEISGAPTARYETSGDADLGAYAGWLGDNPDNYMEWRDVYSFFGGKYRLTIAYASASARSLELYVNGELKRTFRNLNNGSWSSNWGKTNINIELQPGSNTIRLGSSSGFAPNIDYIQLRKTGDLDAVEGVKADSQEARAAWFGIDGKRHNAPRKGMNIKYLPNKKSKKVLVK